MAKSFYTSKEAAEKLGKSEDDLKGFVRDGSLREFRDGDKTNYKVQDVDQLAATLGISSGDSVTDLLSGSASGELILEPVEDSGVDLMSASGSGDILGLADTDLSGTAGGTNAAGKSGSGIKGDTVVPSAGANIFDDDDLDEMVDPLAQTAVTDLGGLGMDGSGSGSGIMDLTRESDDTSLGAELLEEIYTGEEDGLAEDPSDDTKAGMEERLEDGDEEVFELSDDDHAPTTAGVTAVREVIYANDPLSSGLTAAMIVAVVVMLLAGLAAAGLARGVVPSLLQTVFDNLMIFSGASLGLGIAAAGITFVIAKRKN